MESAKYLRAVTAAELEWVRAFADDVRTGKITWSEQWLRELPAATEDDPAP